MIKVAGVNVPRAAIAKLAEELQRNGDRAFAHRLGHAIDKNLDRLELTVLESELILAALRTSPIDELEPLRSFLTKPALSRAIKSGGVGR